MKRIFYRLMLCTALTLTACTVDPDDNSVDSGSGGTADSTGDAGEADVSGDPDGGTDVSDDPDATTTDPTTDRNDTADVSACGDTAPPECDRIAPHCAGPTLLVTYADEIPYADDCTCDYGAATHYVECGAFESCEDGACVDPCDEITCTALPDTCRDANTLIVRVSTCNPSTTDCDSSSDILDCIGDEQCLDAEEDSGNDAVCGVPCSRDDDCVDDEVCDGTLCVEDKCLEDPTCPLEVCVDSTTQGIHSADGTCEPISGDCVYDDEATENDCESEVCEDGVCRVACDDNICAIDEMCSGELSCVPIDCENDDMCTETSVRMTCVEMTCQFP